MFDYFKTAQTIFFKDIYLIPDEGVFMSLIPDLVNAQGRDVRSAFKSWTQHPLVMGHTDQNDFSWVVKKKKPSGWAGLW